MPIPSSRGRSLADEAVIAPVFSESLASFSYLLFHYCVPACASACSLPCPFPALFPLLTRLSFSFFFIFHYLFFLSHLIALLPPSPSGPRTPPSGALCLPVGNCRTAPSTTLSCALDVIALTATWENHRAVSASVEGDRGWGFVPAARLHPAAAFLSIRTATLTAELSLLLFICCFVHFQRSSSCLPILLSLHLRLSPARTVRIDVISSLCPLCSRPRPFSGFVSAAMSLPPLRVVRL